MDDMRPVLQNVVAGVAHQPAASSLSHSWLADVDVDRIASRVGTPVFLYSEQRLTDNIDRIFRAAHRHELDGRVEVYVPFFPNANPHLLRSLKRKGVGILAQIPSEYRLLRQYGFENFIVSPGHVSNDEIAFWGDVGHPTFLSSLDEVSFLLTTDPSTVSVRVDSLGSEKPGIKFGQLDELASLLRRHERSLESFEVYCGSGNSLTSMVGILEQVLTIFKVHFPTARSINFAGGHGFAYEPWEAEEKHFAWDAYFAALRDLLNRLEIPRHVKLLFEPARDVLADIGTLLLRVKREVVSNPVSNLVVTDGSRMLMPSAQYRGRRHNIGFLHGRTCEIKAPDAADGLPALIRGRTILRNDYVLPGNYLVPRTLQADDYMIVFDVGAYCATQHMEFLNVPPVPEVLIDLHGHPQIVTLRGNEEDRWRHLLKDPVQLDARARPLVAELR